MATQHQEDTALVAEVTAWMERLATEPLQLLPPSDPALIWLKAQMLTRWDAQRQTIAPIEVGESVQVSSGAAGGVLLLLFFLWRGGTFLSSNAPALAFGIIVSVGLLISAVILAVWPGARSEAS